ncbi:VWA domain-containing protein [Mycolicibacterium mengxianglii]|uniref:VWA domain-containing protein n=1 Tax=Mycolicibacterium mengxianglii TaxID=2736649 RepID=UPI0018D0AD46|nr:VWA domain-containing protein [Mycolicibacterium mengxianglii]
MTFAPVGSPTLLLIIGVALVILRVSALYRISRQSASPQRRRTLLRWCGLTAAVLLILAAAARPGFETGRDVTAAADPTDAPTSALNVFFVLDRSVDAPVSAMRPDVAALIDQYPDARFAVISFATRATVDWPLSDDVWSLDSVVAGLSPYIASTPDPVAQANAFAARDVLRAKAEAALDDYPGSQNLVFYLGTGDPESLVSRGSFDMPEGTVAGGGVLGYDAAGGVDAGRLQEIADQLGVPFSPPGTPITEVVPTVADAGSADTLQVADRRELYWLLTALAAALLLAEFALTLREYRKNRLSRREVTR